MGGEFIELERVKTGMAKKVYAVRRGKVTGLFDTWDECRDSVYGYPGAEYKSFGTREAAEDYLAGASGATGTSEMPCGTRVDPGSGAAEGPEAIRCGGRRKAAREAAGESAGNGAAKAGPGVTAGQKRGTVDELVAYVDGSYNSATKEFSYGVVLLLPDEDLCFSQKMDDRELAQMHNVAGEIKGSEAAMRYALEHGYRKVIIHHDYEGIAKWCLGQWKTNKEGTRAYKAFYDSIRGDLKVEFVKVTGHSGDKYNDVADALAKDALGIG